jgi:hypothetical protein
MTCRRNSRKVGFGSGKLLEPIYQLTVEGLFGDVASLIEWIKSIGEAIVEDRETRNLLPKEIV